jgi:hypothetical protein
VTLAENIAHEPVALALTECAIVVRGDSGSILTSMLEHRQRII